MQVSEFLSLLNQTITSLPANVLADLVNSMNVQLASDLTDTFGTKATQDLLKKACSGDMVFVATPAEVETEDDVAGSGSARTVTVELQSAAGDVHTWFNATIANGFTVAEVTGGDGVLSFATGSTVTAADAVFVNGVASDIVYDRLTWAANDTGTLTMIESTILGYTIAAVTSEETIVNNA